MRYVLPSKFLVNAIINTPDCTWNVENVWMFTTKQLHHETNGGTVGVQSSCVWAAMCYLASNTITEASSQGNTALFSEGPCMQ